MREVAAAIAPSLRPGDLVVSTQPEQIPVLHHYLPPGLRYATLWGPVDDLGVTDWRDGVRAAARHDGPARPHAAAGQRSRAGSRIVLVEPIVNDIGQLVAPWTELDPRALDGVERSTSPTTRG